MHIAAALDDAATIAALADADGDVNNISPFTGESPLHWAAQCNAAQAIGALLERGGACDCADDLGRTPLHHAAMLGRAGAARALRERGRAFVAAETRDGSSPMLLAALGGHVALARELHASGVAVDNVRGDTLLWAAVSTADWKRVAELVKSGGASGARRLATPHASARARHQLSRRSTRRSWAC